MSTTDFTTREYQIGDEEQIVELLKLSFPEWENRKNPLDHWRWKYSEAPMSSTINVVVSGDKIVGVGHEMYGSIKIGSGVVPSLYSDDYATHPEFRGKGVYNRLAETWDKLTNQKFVFWLTTNPIIINSELKRQKPTTFNFPYPLKHLLRLHNVDTHLDKKTVKNRTITRAGLEVYKALNKAENIIPRTGNKSINAEITEITSFGEAYNEFWSQISQEHNFIRMRDTRYLNWRYADRRGGTYIIRQAKKKGTLAGFSVLETRIKNNYSEGYIVDILALDGSSDIYHALLEDACSLFDDAGLNAAHLQLIEGHPLQKITAKHGFVMPPGTNYIHIGCDLTEIYNKNRAELESSKPDQLHFGYGDYF